MAGKHYLGAADENDPDDLLSAGIPMLPAGMNELSYMPEVIFSVDTAMHGNAKVRRYYEI